MKKIWSLILALGLVLGAAGPMPVSAQDIPTGSTGRAMMRAGEEVKLAFESEAAIAALGLDTLELGAQVDGIGRSDLLTGTALPKNLDDFNTSNCGIIMEVEGTLPTGVKMDPQGYDAFWRGYPTVVGENYSFTLKASLENDPSFTPVELPVTGTVTKKVEGDCFEIDDWGLLSFMVGMDMEGKQLSANFRVSNPSGSLSEVPKELVKWRLEDGSLPDGLTLTESGLSGFLTKAGSYTFTVSATFNNTKVLKQLSATIKEGPTFTSNPSPLRGTAGQAFSAQLSASYYEESAGTTYYGESWELVNSLGGLSLQSEPPDAATNHVTLGGTLPAQAGEYMLTVKARVGSGTYGSYYHTYPLTVTKDVKLTYDANASKGGIGEAQTATISLPAEPVPIKDGTTFSNKDDRAFIGWNTKADGSGTPYSPGGMLSLTQDTTLYAQWSLQATYDANGGQGGLVVENCDKDGSATVRDSNGFSKTGWIFDGWNTAADGSGTPYSPGETLSLTQDTTLYAQWKEPAAQLTLTYKANGGRGDDIVRRYSPNAQVTVDGNSFSAPGGARFAGWNTDQNGNGTRYQPGAQFNILADTTLYAQWEVALAYDMNDGSGQTARKTLGYDKDATVQAVSELFTVPAGRSFKGWSALPDGSGALRQPGDAIRLTQDATLYAQWEVTLTYHPNGGSGVARSQEYGFSKTATIENSGYSHPEAKRFIGWTRQAQWDGDPSSLIPPGGKLALFAHTTLYAQWADNTAARLTLTYKANGGAGNDVVRQHSYGDLVTVDGNSFSAPGGARFAGWNTDQNGNGTRYQPGEAFNILADTTLYAQWEVTLTYDMNDGGGQTARKTLGYDKDATVQAASGLFTVPEGRSFKGWSALPDGSGALRQPGDAIRLTQDATLYAQWEVTLTYDMNDGGGTTRREAHGLRTSIGIPRGIDVFAPPPGKYFLTWNTRPDGGGEEWKPGSSLLLLTHTTLYAQWDTTPVQPPAQYRLTVISGTGSGSYEAGERVDIQADSLSGKEFARWQQTVGNAGHFADPLSAATGFIMPDSDATVEALYRALPPAGDPDDEDEDDDEESKRYYLHVVNGRGSGWYYPGEEAGIYADVPGNSEFRRWVKEYGAGWIEDFREPDTIFTMGSSDAEVRAVYDAGPAQTVEKENPGTGAVPRGRASLAGAGLLTGLLLCAALRTRRRS